MRNVMAVAGKELRAYFHSPIAYLVMTVYTVICGFVFYSSTAFFVLQTFRMEMQGGMGAPPMSLNENIIRPILGGVMTVVLLFLDSAHYHAAVRRGEALRHHRTAAHLPAHRHGNHPGKISRFAGSVRGAGSVDVCLFHGSVHLREPQCQAADCQRAGLAALRRRSLALGMWFSTFTKNQIIAGAVGLAAFLLLYLLDWVTAYSQHRRAGDVLSGA